MVRLRLSSDDIYVVELPNTISDLEAADAYTVRNLSGEIIKPDAESYGEILAAMTAHVLIKTTTDSVLDDGKDQAQALSDFADLRINQIDASSLGAAISKISVFGTTLLGAALTGSAVGPVGTLIGGAAGVIGGTASALSVDAELDLARGAESFYRAFFKSLGASAVESITSAQSLQPSTSGAEVSTLDIFNVWLGYVDATVVVPQIWQILKTIDEGLQPVVPDLATPFEAALQALGTAQEALALDAITSDILGLLADRVQPVGDAAVAAAADFDTKWAARAADLFDAAARDEAAAALTNALESNARIVNTIDVLGTSLGVITALSDLSGLVDVFERIAQFKELVTKTGETLAQIVEVARLDQGFVTQASRAPFIERAEHLPILGSPTSDVIVGTEKDDIIGGDPDDGSPGGNDQISGGSGDDQISVNGGNDEIDAGSGDDVVIPGLGTDVITLGSGRDLVRGSLAALGDDGFNDLEIGDKVELQDIPSNLPSFADEAISIEDTSIGFDFDLNGSVDFSLNAVLPENTTLALRSEAFDDTSGLISIVLEVVPSAVLGYGFDPSSNSLN